MENIQITLTAQELEDIRQAVIASWFKLTDEQEKSDRISLLMDKLAKASVFGHA